MFHWVQLRTDQLATGPSTQLGPNDDDPAGTTYRCVLVSVTVEQGSVSVRIIGFWLPFVVEAEGECRRTRQRAGTLPGLTTGSHSIMQNVTHWMIKATGEIGYGEGNGGFGRILVTAPSSHIGGFVLSVTQKTTVYFCD